MFHNVLALIAEDLRGFDASTIFAVATSGASAASHVFLTFLSG